MSDEQIVDTPVPPAESGQEMSPEPTESATEPTEPIESTEPELSPEDRALQKMQSWQGRRDKDFLGAVSNLIEQKMQSLRPPAPEQEPADYASQLLENPEAVIENVLTKREQRTTQYQQMVISGAGRLMESDPLFEDTTFGNEVIQEIQKIAPQFMNDPRMPANISANMMVKEAMANVYRKQRTAKTNPLAGNTPGAKGAGGITASAAPARAVKPPKMSPEVEKMAKTWGYSTEDLVKVFGEDK